MKMKKNEEIDQLIKEALSADEKELFDSYDEQNLLEMIGGLFDGKLKWLNTLTIIVQVVVFGFCVYFAYRFFTTSETAELIKFGIGIIVTMISITYIKIFHLMEMNKNATIREMKRVELQLSMLAGKLNPK